MNSLVIDTVQSEAQLPFAASSALTPMQMAYQLIAKGADPSSIKEMLDVGREIERDQARRAFDAALSAAKAEIPPIFKNRAVDFTSAKGRTNYRHEDLGEIARTVDPIMARHGLSYRFRTEQSEGGMVRVTCVVAHRDGHSEENALSAGRDESGNKNNIQAIGSTITYLQRYTLKAALGLAASSDDDGQRADAKGPVDLTATQIKELDALIAESGADVAKFCEAFKVETVLDLAPRDFDRAVSSLKAKITRKNEAAK